MTDADKIAAIRERLATVAGQGSWRAEIVQTLLAALDERDAEIAALRARVEALTIGGDMTERKIMNPKDGYTEFVKPQRDEREFKKKVEEEVKQRLSGMAVNGSLLSPTGGVMEKGAVQMRVEKDAAAAGNNIAVLAAQAAAELRQEGKL